MIAPQDVAHFNGQVGSVQEKVDDANHPGQEIAAFEKSARHKRAIAAFGVSLQEINGRFRCARRARLFEVFHPLAVGKQTAVASEVELFVALAVRVTFRAGARGDVCRAGLFLLPRRHDNVPASKAAQRNARAHEEDLLGLQAVG